MFNSNFKTFKMPKVKDIFRKGIFAAQIFNLKNL